jgi:PAS domain S-box-containing protein
MRERGKAFFQGLMKTLSCLARSSREARRCMGSRGAAHPQADETLQHVSSLLDSVTTGIISLDGRGRITVFNRAAENLFNISRSSVLGAPFGEAGRRLDFDDQARRALWERLSDALWAAGAARDLEYDFTPKEGPRRVLSYSVHPLGRTAWSVDNGVVISFEDITRKKDMEDQVSDARKRLQAVFDGITDGIQVIDGEFRITAANRSMNSLIGRKVAVGSHCFESCFFGARICDDCPATETFHAGHPASLTKKLTLKKAGTMEVAERVVEISTFPVLDRAGRVVHVVEYIKDVTERVRLAERLEHSRRLAELGEMAARVAHEVRNPLNAITGAAHFLSTEYGGDETVRKFTSLINRQATRVNQVASDLLAVSRPMQPRLTDVNVNAVLEQTLDSLCGQMQDHGITLQSRLSPDNPVIRADELQIEQALQNILRNAIEAMPDGGALTVGTEPGADRKWVDVHIQDTGPGIPEKDRERIFQSFFTTKIRGTGLGLTIVTRVLRNHGGEIFMDQPESGGTRVTVRLPVGKERKDEGGRTTDEGTGKKEEEEGKRDEGDMIFRNPKSAFRI